LKFFAVAAACLLIATSIAARPQSQSESRKQPSPATAGTSKLRISEQKPPAAPPDFSKEPFVIEKFYTTVRFENDGTGERDLHVRARVQSNVGVQRLGELVFAYNSANETVEVQYVRVDKKSGAPVTAAADAIKDMTASVARDAPVYTDYKEKRVTVPALQPGDVLEYEVTTRIVTAIAPGEFWYEHKFVDAAIALDERFELNLPAGRAAIVHSAGVKYAKETAVGRDVYRWQRENLIARHDDDSDDSNSGASSGEASESPVKSHPQAEITSFKSWDEVAKWYAGLEHGRAEPNDDIRAKVAELTRNRATDADKIRALYDYVSTKIRYVSLSFGLGRYQPHTAAEVFANQYGDCKDKHTLLAAMLAVIGIHADSALIPQGNIVDTGVPSPSQFDHLITAIPQSRGKPDEFLWLDTTAEVAPFAYLVPSLRGKRALVVADAGAGAGRFAETPPNPPFAATQTVNIQGSVSDLGKLTATIHYELRGDNEFAFRSALHRTPESEWKRVGQAVAELDGFRGQVTQLEASNLTDTEHPLQLTLHYTQKNFFDWSRRSTRLAILLPTIGMPDPPKDTSRPVVLGTPLDVALRLKLTLPANEKARAPVSVSVVRDYAEYHSSYEAMGDSLHVERTIRFKMREVPAERAGDYAAFARAVAADATQFVAIESNAPGNPEVPASASADELVEAGAAALEGGNSTMAVALFRRAGDLDPKRKDVWVNLGLAELRLRQLDESAAAFQKQLALDPFDPSARDYLGVVLTQQQKFDEAAADFRKQLEQSPLDNFAHASLGILLVQEKKYSEAVPELEKAAVLTPDSAQIQLTLGQAYLNVGKKADAMAAFDKANQIAATPETWNDIAYDLAQQNVDLDKARDYAESAVDATAAALRNMNIELLTANDLAEVQNIGAYWDTLGWIHFQKGETDAAEPYLRAAWQLTQNGDVGDHLARLYQKRGDKDLAAKTLALALAAPHADPESRARLLLLLGDSRQADAAVKQAAPELDAARTYAITIAKASPEDASAEFYIDLAPAEGGSSTIQNVKFIRGTSTLRNAAAALRSIDFGKTFPNAEPGKLIRRGTLHCAKSESKCTFVLERPEDVRGTR
jgi:tetratricopeptide (TPR) repeat protein/transglutaminase-like putative cysteine protease